MEICHQKVVLSQWKKEKNCKCIVGDLSEDQEKKRCAKWPTFLSSLWWRVNGHDPSSLIFQQWLFDPYQLVWCKIFLFHFLNKYYGTTVVALLCCINNIRIIVILSYISTIGIYRQFVLHQCNLILWTSQESR